MIRTVFIRFKMKPMSFKTAVALGLEPRVYPWDIPKGVYLATLDFRIWGKGKRKPSIQCYFSADDEEKYLLTTFRTRDQTMFSPPDEEVDFSSAGLEGLNLILTVGRNTKGNPKWLEADVATPVAIRSYLARNTARFSG